ncbi:MAG TPA: tetratricopeptide repeat protein [Acidobacteriota bacterium]|nr:tetratricopeptide repeat protein [Acidobacteriota bacterium]
MTAQPIAQKSTRVQTGIIVASPGTGGILRSGMPHERGNRWYYIGIGVALALGAAVRIVYLWQINGNPFFDHFVSDAAHFDRWARAIAAGDLLGSGPFFRAPLYPYFLGFLYWLTGPDYLWIRVVQHAIGLGGVWATATLARRLWNERVGVVAAFLAAIYPTAIFFEGELLLDFLLVSLTPVTLLVLLAAVRQGRARTALAAGLLTGLCAVARPTILATVPVLIAWVWWANARDGSRRRGLLAAVGVLAGIVLVVLPVTLRNAVVSHDTVLISTQGGVNFFIGNNPAADGASAVLPPHGTAWTNADATAQAETSCGRTLKPSGVSTYWWGRGLEFWRDHPLDALPLLGRKLVLFWQNTEFANNQSIDWFTRRWGAILRWLPLSFGLVVAFGVLGWITALHDRDRIWVLVWSLAYALTVAMFFVIARLRLPVVPVWIGAAAAGGVELFDRLRIRDIRRFVVGAVLVIACAVPAHIDWFGIRRQADPRSFLALGNIHLTEGRTALARAALDSALAINPDYRGVWLSRGTAFYLEGEADSAAACYRKELERQPSDPQALTGLVQTALDRNDTATAVDFLDRISFNRHTDIHAVKMKAGLLRALHHPEEALGLLTNADVGGRSFDYIAPLEGVTLLDLGRLEEAEAVFLRYLRSRHQVRGIEADPDPEPFLLRGDPTRDRALANYNLGVIAGYRRDWQRAIAYLDAAVAIDPGLGAAWSNLTTAHLQVGAADAALAAARRAMALEARNPIYLFGLAMAQLAGADTVAAAATLERAVAVDSLLIPAREALDALGSSR